MLPHGEGEDWVMVAALVLPDGVLKISYPGIWEGGGILEG